MLVEEFFWLEVVARAGEETKEAINLFAFLDDLTMVTQETFFENGTRAMEAALSKVRQVVNQMKGTIWTSTGLRPNTERVGTMSWNHVGQR